MKTNKQILEQMIAKCDDKRNLLLHSINAYNTLINQEAKRESMYKLMHGIDTYNGTVDEEYLFNYPDSYIKLVAKKENIPLHCGNDYESIFNSLMHNVKSNLDYATDGLYLASKKLDETLEEKEVLQKALNIVNYMEALS